jgi:O-antigen/teichoic acid export membrane protein
VGNVLFVFVARRLYPELKVRLKKPNLAVLRKIWSYSAYVFLLMVAVQLVYQTDNVVVGVFVSASAVTFYSIGNSLCRYTQGLVGVMTATFTPAASTYDAAGDTSSLRALYYNGTRATMAVSLPILITLIFRGDNFIGVWMGREYREPCWRYWRRRSCFHYRIPPPHRLPSALKNIRQLQCGQSVRQSQT